MINEIVSEDTFYLNGAPNEFTLGKEVYTYDSKNNLVEAKAEKKSKNNQNFYYNKTFLIRRFSYDQNNNLTRSVIVDSNINSGNTLWFNTTTDYQYNGDKLVGLININTGNQGFVSSKETVTFYYSGNILSQITSTDDQGSAIQYEVSDKGYITKHVVDGYGETFTYDAEGNIIQRGHTDGYSTIFTLDQALSIEEKQNPQFKGVLKNFYLLSSKNVTKSETFYVLGTNPIYEVGSLNTYEYNNQNLPIKAVYKSLNARKQVYYIRNLSYSFTNCN